jgi:hypothetical protein
MRFPTLMMAAASAAFVAPAVAHPEHDQARAPASPTQEARSSLMRLVSQAKLPASWGSATLVDAKARTRNGTSQTVVTFRNDAERNKARKMLYVVVANGNVVSTGHKLN